MALDIDHALKHTLFTVHTLHSDGTRTERRCFGDDALKRYLDKVRKDSTLIGETDDQV